jgi:hypothetical protein
MTSRGEDPSGVASTAVEATLPLAYRSGRSLLDTLAAARRFLRAAVDRTEHGDGGLAELARLADLELEVRRAVDGCAVWLLEHDDASYREVGAALGMSLQAVAKRYPGLSSRPAGGQESRLR